MGAAWGEAIGSAFGECARKVSRFETGACCGAVGGTGASCVAGGVEIDCALLICADGGALSGIVTGSANRTCCPSMDCRTGDCWVDGGVGCAAAVGSAVSGVDCDVVVEVAASLACSSTAFGAGFAGGAGGAAGRRRGGALGAAFLPDVAELMSVDIAQLHGRRVVWSGKRRLGWLHVFK